MLLSELNWLLFGRSYQRNVHNLCLTKVYFQQLLKPGMKFTYTYIQFWKYTVSNVVFPLALGMLKSTLAISTSAACASADSEIRLRQSWPKQTLTERVCVCTCHIYIYIYIHTALHGSPLERWYNLYSFRGGFPTILHSILIVYTGLII